MSQKPETTLLASETGWQAPKPAEKLTAPERFKKEIIDSLKAIGFTVSELTPEEKAGGEIMGFYKKADYRASWSPRPDTGDVIEILFSFSGTHTVDAKVSLDSRLSVGSHDLTSFELAGLIQQAIDRSRRPFGGDDAEENAQKEDEMLKALFSKLDILKEAYSRATTKS